MAVRIGASDGSQRKPVAPAVIAVSLASIVPGASRWLTDTLAIAPSRSHPAQALPSAKSVVKFASVRRHLFGRRPNSSIKPNPLRGSAYFKVLGALNLELQRFSVSVAAHGHSTPPVAGFGQLVSAHSALAHSSSVALRSPASVAFGGA